MQPCTTLDTLLEVKGGDDGEFCHSRACVGRLPVHQLGGNDGAEPSTPSSAWL